MLAGMCPAGDWTREGTWLQDYLAGQWIFSSPGICLSCFDVLQNLFCEQGPWWGWAGSGTSTHLEPVTTRQQPLSRVLQEWPCTNVFTADLVLVLQGVSSYPWGICRWQWHEG